MVTNELRVTSHHLALANEVKKGELQREHYVRLRAAGIDSYMQTPMAEAAALFSKRGRTPISLV